MRKNGIGENNEFPELVSMNQSTRTTGHIPMMSKGSKDAVTVKPTDQIICKWIHPNQPKQCSIFHKFGERIYRDTVNLG